MASRDYEEFIAALNANGVRYLVVGAHAVALHALPRATKDLDIWLDRSPANARRALRALRQFFHGTDLGYSAADLADPDSIIQLGVAPVRIDLLKSVSGTTFQTGWKRRAKARFGAAPAWFLSLEDLIRAKQAAGRAQDRADVEMLRRVQRRKRAGRRS
jgi:hypothetical protein